MKLNTLISKFINRIRLIGKFRHLYRIRVAKKVLAKLIQIAAEHPHADHHRGRIISYLRKINPFVFEELVLSVIEHSNIQIIRNVRYTGDGGIDGIFKLKFGKVLIQCKRYAGYINNKDVNELCEKVKTEKCVFGIFVHTGKTGEKSKTIVTTHQNVCFISGQLLIDFLLGKVMIEKHLETKIAAIFKK